MMTEGGPSRYYMRGADAAEVSETLLTSDLHPKTDSSTIIPTGPIVLNQETAMLAFARLALLSHQRQQPLGTEKFIVLTGIAACRSGWLDLASQCWHLLASLNAQHFVVRSGSFPNALRDASLKNFVTMVERFCSFEQAEHLLDGHGGVPQLEDGQEAGEAAALDLQQIAVTSTTV